LNEDIQVIDANIANDSDSTANTSVPAEFAGFPAVEWFISNVGLNKKFFIACLFLLLCDFVLKWNID
jgi:hypothetical protein